MRTLFNATNIRIGRNASIKLIAELSGRVSTFVLALVAARNLSETDFGLYNYGLALGFVVAQFADFGLQMLISREVAVRGRDAQPLVMSALRLKLLLSVAVLTIMFLLTNSWSGDVRMAMLALGLMMLAQTYLEFVAYVFRGEQDLRTEGTLLAASRLLMGLLGIVIVLLTGQLLLLALSNLAAVGVITLVGLFWLRRSGWLGHSGESATFIKDEAGRNRYLVQQAYPIGLAIIFSIAYTRLAVIMLQNLGGAEQVAQFSAAQRLVEPAQIIPAALLAAVFPVYSLALFRDRRQARSLGARVSLLLAGGGSCLAITFWLLAPWLITFLYGLSYEASIPVLRVLGLSVVFTFVNYSLTHYLIARGRQRAIVTFTAAMLLLHALLSWLLIPLLGPVGPAISIVVAEALLFICCFLTLLFRRPVPYNAATPEPSEPDPAGSFTAL